MQRGILAGAFLQACGIDDARAFAARPGRLVHQDPRQPGQERAAAFEALGVLESPQEGRLHQILGLGRLGRQVQCQAQELGRAAVEDLPERRRVTLRAVAFEEVLEWVAHVFHRPLLSPGVPQRHGEALRSTSR